MSVVIVVNTEQQQKEEEPEGFDPVVFVVRLVDRGRHGAGKSGVGLAAAEEERRRPKKGDFLALFHGQGSQEKLQR